MLLVLAAGAGCSPPQVQSQVYQGGPVARPDRVVVHDFAVRPQEVRLDSGLRGRLTQALAAVRPDQAAAIRARVLEEREYSDIAAEFHTTPDVIRARVSRGLKTMQRFLGDSFPDALADT
jgi:DNA-directed RNA polymerase specialized sigma24 family protein